MKNILVQTDVSKILSYLDEIDATLDLGDIVEARQMLVSLGENLRDSVAAEREFRSRQKKESLARKEGRRGTPGLDQLAKIKGYEDYSNYLRSDYWMGLKERYKSAWSNCKCVGCGNEKYELHHLTYERFGCEDLKDLLPLCHRCHKAVHRAKGPRRVRLFKLENSLQLLFNLPAWEVRKRLEPYYQLNFV